MIFVVSFYYLSNYFLAAAHNGGVGTSASSMLVISRHIAAPTPTCSIAPSSIQPIPVPIIEDQPMNIDIASALIDLSVDRNCFEVGATELEGFFV